MIKMESETGIVRPGHKKIDAGVSSTGEVLLVVVDEGTTIRAFLPPEVARQIGCGLIGGAAIGEQISANAKKIVAPVAQPRKLT